MTDQPILMFDSGVGGLTVLREARVLMPDRRFVYVADDAAFPFGAWEEPALRTHILELFAKLLDRFTPAISVIACNTASTLVLPHLRTTYTVPFVGTVPAIKPACAASRSKRVSVLGTKGTVKREYTQGLIRDFGAGCEVTLVGAAELASIAEAALRDEPVSDADVAHEIAPCFVDGPARTDTIVLACTHYPLLLDRMVRLAPWPVDWIDPAPAIARRTAELIGTSTGAGPGRAQIIFTSGQPPSEGLTRALSPYFGGLQPA